MNIWKTIVSLFSIGGGPTPKRKLHHTQTPAYRRAASLRSKALWAKRRKAMATPTKAQLAWTPERRLRQAENARNQAIKRRLEAEIAQRQAQSPAMQQLEVNGKRIQPDSAVLEGSAKTAGSP